MLWCPSSPGLKSQAQHDVWWEIVLANTKPVSPDFAKYLPPAIGWEMEERPWDTTCVYVVEKPGAVRGVPLSDPVAEDQLLCGRDLHRSHQYWQQWDSAMGQSENIIGLSQNLHRSNQYCTKWIVYLTNEARFNWSPFQTAKNGSPLPQKSGSNWHLDPGEKILLALDQQLLRGVEPTFEIDQH